MEAFSIDPATTVGPVALTVANLRRSEEFYVDTLGLQILDRAGPQLTLGAGNTTPIVQLTEQPGAQPKPTRATGLYHFAILVPSRLDLARSLRRIAELRYPISGASDHLVSEALYLDDPDGNGIEIYRDRPRAEWPRVGGQIRMAVDPLDIDGVLSELERDTRPWNGIAPGTILGHMHLQVADLRAAEAFYCGILGFDLMVRYGQGALFVSAGGYHHHLGLNTWAGVGAPPAPPGSAGMRWFAVELPNQTALELVLARVQAAGLPAQPATAGVLVGDPSANRVMLTVAPHQRA